jgi:UDP-N-acetylmuramoyl-tripeptide--D-alanyl-D-alanine ligase
MATPIPVNHAEFSASDLRSLNGALSDSARAVPNVTGVTANSREVRAGNLFIALKGEVHDAHRFAGDAVRRGAVVVLAESGTHLEGVSSASVIYVPSTHAALRELAALHLERWRHGQHRKSVFCITGSSGKTTKEMLAGLLALRMPVQKTLGNLNNLIGLPFMALTLDASHESMVFEAGMSVPGELALLASLVKPDVAAILNVGLAHAEGVGGPDGIAHEKGSVYEHLRSGGFAIVNQDDPRARAQVSRAQTPKIVSFGTAKDGADYSFTSRSVLPSGELHCVLRRLGESASISLPFLSPAQTTDLLCALACAETHCDSFSPSEIEQAMRALVLEGRATIKELPGGITLIDDTYNANPESMGEAIRLLSELGEKRRRVAIVGDMRELGTYSVSAHLALGESLVNARVSLVIGCGTEIMRTLDVTRTAGIETHHAETPQSAGKLANARLLGTDIVLVKASRGIALEAAVSVIEQSRE